MFGDDNDSADYSAYFDPSTFADPQTVAAARAAALRGAPTPDATQAPNLPAIAAARAGVLRGRAPDATAPNQGATPNDPNPSYYGGLGLVASMSGDPVLNNFGRAATQYANQLRETQGQQLMRMLEQKRNDQTAQFHQDEVADRQQQIALQREEMNRSRYRPFIDPTNGRSGILDSWTGQMVNGATASAGAPPSADGAAPEPALPPMTSRAGQQEEKIAERYAEALNPAKATPDLWKKLQFGARIKPMIQQGLSSGSMNDQMARELASAFASYVSGGGAPAEEQVKSLLPPSFTGNLANLGNYLTNDLKGADRTAWLTQLSQSLEREEPVIQNGIREVLLHNDAGFPAMHTGALGTTRKQVLAGLKKQGYALEDEPQGASAAGLNLDASATSPSRAPVAHPQDSAAVTWAKAHPGDPRAIKILQANGVQ